MLRDIIDEIREARVEDVDTSPTREVVYKIKATSSELILNSYVGVGTFNKEERDNINNVQSFGGLKLENKPKVGDTVTYDGTAYKVTRFTKLGNLYIVYTEQSRQSRRGA